MISKGNKILIRFKRRWQLMLWIEICLYALGPACLVYFLFLKLSLFFIAFIVLIAATIIFIKPWKTSLEQVSGYIDQRLDIAEYSTGLLLLPNDNLSSLAKLQQHKVERELSEQLRTITPPNHVVRSIIILFLFVIIGVSAYKFNVINYFQKSEHPKAQPEQIIFNPVDSTTIKIRPPELQSQRLVIKYPKYTGIPSFQTSEMDIQAIEGARLFWQLKFDSEVDTVIMESIRNEYPMKLIDEAYERSSILNTSGFYNFRFSDLEGNSYTSKLYSIEVIKDKTPTVEILGIKQFTSFSFNDNKNLVFNTQITDDFGIANAYIIATVSKGSGESVKFREEKLNFDTGVVVGGKKQNLSKNINLDQMKMEPGDELYFYVEVSDQKQPQANTSRSETFFAVIKDTVSNQFAVEGTMGVDLMPDYFRSQRQLIIDTEKLLKNKPKHHPKEFKFKSNELGFDQKVLRLKYSEFMGDESEFGPANQENNETPSHEEDHDEEDPLASYTHDHDGENEHNLVDHENEKEDGKSTEDPLHEYLHNHEDPEASTLFEKSLKSKLRQALNEMWDAELHLRLYTPEKSLPYQYKALKLIQEIKNSARIYVHRIGFDPPPIKNDKRLTGKIDEVSNFRKSEELHQPEMYPSMHKAILRLEQLVLKKESITEVDKVLFKQAGNELAIKAIENPGKYLKSLQQLKRITEGGKIPYNVLIEIQKGLFSAIPDAKPNPSKKGVLTSEINELLLKELEIHD